MKKSSIITIAIIVGVIFFAYFLKSYSNSSDINVDEEIAKCIGENAELYVQLGCHACRIQEEMFEENVEYLTIIDCFYDREKCKDIAATPTWMINGENYIGVRSIEELKNLTGC